MHASENVTEGGGPQEHAGLAQMGHLAPGENAAVEGVSADSKNSGEASKRKPGRPKGSKNRVAAEIKLIAQKHGPRTIREIAKIAFGKPAEGESATEKQLRVRCMEILLDRGYGRPVTPNELTGKDGAPLAVALIDFLRGLPN